MCQSEQSACARRRICCRAWSRLQTEVAHVLYPQAMMDDPGYRLGAVTAPDAQSG